MVPKMNMHEVFINDTLNRVSEELEVIEDDNDSLPSLIANSEIIENNIINDFLNYNIDFDDDDNDNGDDDNDDDDDDNSMPSLVCDDYLRFSLTYNNYDNNSIESYYPIIIDCYINEDNNDNDEDNQMNRRSQ